MTKAKMTSRSGGARYRVHGSAIHDTGLFATQAIRRGARIIEYVGERISHDEAERRHAGKDSRDNHTFLFTVDDEWVIDAGVDGNEARFINHSCDPNCESIVEDGRVFIEAVRTISPDEELTYDYNIERSDDDPPDVEQIFACRCGAPCCRKTMLVPVKAKPVKRRKKVKVTSREQTRSEGP